MHLKIWGFCIKLFSHEDYNKIYTYEKTCIILFLYKITISGHYLLPEDIMSTDGLSMLKYHIFILDF